MHKQIDYVFLKIDALEGLGQNRCVLGVLGAKNRQAYLYYAHAPIA